MDSKTLGEIAFQTWVDSLGTGKAWEAVAAAVVAEHERRKAAHNALPALLAERDRLEAEVERAKADVVAALADALECATECEQIEARAEAAEARCASLRGALEEVLFECDGHADCDDGDDGIANIPNMAMRCEMICNAALAETHAASLGKLKTEVLRGLKNMAARKVDGDYVVFLPHILAEAKRIEKSADEAEKGGA
jgi:DNA repair exonuclease SbcCD ATPase subunit